MLNAASAWTRGQVMHLRDRRRITEGRRSWGKGRYKGQMQAVLWVIHSTCVHCVHIPVYPSTSLLSGDPEPQEAEAGTQELPSPHQIGGLEAPLGHWRERLPPSPLSQLPAWQ